MCVLGRVDTRILAVADLVPKRECSPNQPELCGRAGWLPVGHPPHQEDDTLLSVTWPRTIRHTKSHQVTSSHPNLARAPITT